LQDATGAGWVAASAPKTMNAANILRIDFPPRPSRPSGDHTGQMTPWHDPSSAGAALEIGASGRARNLARKGIDRRLRRFRLTTRIGLHQNATHIFSMEL
ncbi:hypothetical protein, partial [Mesorhizobium sp. M4A.F.Ca.ET.020.02.1.1]|uniref:hypothetical protein n=1 Tax=Mesorhizobium sp. M4A.F.Ca.ET.020.02.1.1 TaxID=2496652 RepID=UPI001AEC775C